MSGRRVTRLSKEDRVASLLADIDALPRSRRNDRPGTVRVDTDLMISVYSIVREAAKVRRITVAAYMRRAAMAMACHDLGLDLSEALTRDPRVSRDTGFATTDPEGTIFGPWEIERLRGEDDGTGSEEEVAAGAV